MSCEMQTFSELLGAMPPPGLCPEPSHFSSLTYYLCNSKPPQMEETGTKQPRPDKDKT